jgi:Spy/CpxP family protein refolding chaperone
MSGLNKKQFFAGFALGVLVGAILVGLFVKAAIQRHKNPEAHKARMVKRIKKGLNLDEAQTAKVKAVIDRTHAEMTSSFKEARARHDKLHMEARGEIRSLLDAEQQVKFDKFVEKWDKRRRRRRKHGPSPEKPE